MKTKTLYLLTTSSGGTYFGITSVGIEKRASLHKKAAQKKVPEQKVGKEIKVCGGEFEIVELRQGDEKYIRRLEERVIRLFKPTLNIAIGSRVARTEEFKKKLSARMKGNKITAGKKQSFATVQNRVKKNTGRKRSKEFCIKMKGIVKNKERNSKGMFT